MTLNFDGLFGVKTKAKLDNSEVHEKPVQPVEQQPVQKPVILTTDAILNKLFDGVDETSIRKYRTGMVKMEDIFQTDVEKQKENIAATANSVLGLFQRSTDEDGITAHDKESFTKYCDNFKALTKEEKDYLVSNLTDETKNQMSKGETVLIEELISNYSHRTEMDAMNPFAF